MRWTSAPTALAAAGYAVCGVAALAAPEWVRELPGARAAVAGGYLVRILGLYALLLAALTLLGLFVAGTRLLLAVAPAAHLLHAFGAWRAEGPASVPSGGAAVAAELGIAAVLAAAPLGGDPPDRPGARAGRSGKAVGWPTRAALLFAVGYHVTQGLPALLPTPAVLGWLEALYGWRLGGLLPGDFDLLRIYVALMLAAALPAGAALLDPRRFRGAVGCWAVLFGAKALLLLAVAGQVRAAFGVTPGRLGVQVCVLLLLATILGSRAAGDRTPAGAP